ncbi:hypothetical protein MOOTH_16700 [Moorella thermoacetica]|nr:hypothetical protein MOOTH_16700 [Moorella thermoacetica]
MRADSYSRRRFETNTYSVPQSYARQQLVLRAYVDKIEVWAGKELIATHPRSYGKGEEHLGPRHYLKALERKPRALKKSVSFFAAIPVPARPIHFVRKANPTFYTQSLYLSLIG